MKLNHLVCASLLCLSPAGAFGADVKMPPAAASKIDFEKQVWPLLAEKCHSCHGSKQAQSGLRLDKRQNALRGGDYGPVILPGRSAESKLILRVVNGDGGMQMPPSGALSADEIGVLRAWIDQGGEFIEAAPKEKPAPKPVDPALRELISAIRGREVAKVRQLLKARPALATGADTAGATPLHHAAGFGTPEMAALLIDKGANLNARNVRNATPLHWAIGNTPNVKLLLEKGASIDLQTEDGRTPLYLSATSRFSTADMRLLLEKGANPNIATINGGTALMVSAGIGNAEAMGLLLGRKADAKAVNGTGANALFAAIASGNREAIQLLIDAGLDVNQKTKRNGTVLHMAAMQGQEDVVRQLLVKGANINDRDYRGYNALMYAAYSEVTPAGIVKLLLSKGADTTVSGEGETPKSLAAKRGDTEVARLLGVSAEARAKAGVAVPMKLAPPSRSIPEAIELALQQVVKQSPHFVKTGGCNSCHNQSIPSVAVALAKERGVPAPRSIVELSDEFIDAIPERAMDLIVNGVSSLGYQMFRNAANHRPADEYTDSIVRYLKMAQLPNGQWQTAGNRPPLTFDDFISTAMTINTLRTYGMGASQREDTERRLALAAKWLESAKPSTTQERAFHLLGLAWANAKPAAIESAARGLAASQRADGGWAQLPSMGSDSYATGEALYALHLAGKMTTADPVYQKGVQYLRRTQAADGTWLVKTRSLPTQPYFESGFPYGHDQWISAAGTGWAAMALTLTVEPQKISQR